jgi:amino acid adenylation domain-containing protein
MEFLILKQFKEEMKVRNKQYSTKASIFAGEQCKEREYWLDKLSSGLVKSVFPQDYNKTAVGKPVMDTVNLDIDRRICSRLLNMGSGSNIKLHMILVAGLMGLLYKYTGNTDILIGIPIYKQKIEGELINTVLPLRQEVKGHKTFKDLLLQVNRLILEAAENQNYPMESLLFHLGIPLDDQADFPLFDIAVLLENIHDKAYIGHLRLNLIFSFLRKEATDEIEVTLTYNALRYNKRSMERLVLHLHRCLEETLFNPNVPLADLDILSEEEKNRLITHFNQTDIGYPTNKSIAHLFAEQVKKNRDKVAVVNENETLTYNELAKKAKRLAGVLHSTGVKPGTIAAVAVRPSIEMMVGILGILTAGAIYMPIAPECPPEHIAFLMEDSAAAVLLTTTELSNQLGIVKRKIYLDAEETYPVEAGEGKNCCYPTDPVYIIYTSGTTGRPKGVIIEHRNVVRLFFNDNFPFYFDHHDVWTLFHSYCFDFSVWEMYGALLYGGELVIVPYRTARDPGLFRELLRKTMVTVLNQTPSSFYMLSDEEVKHTGSELERIRYVILGGEALRPTKLKEWQVKYPGTKLINMYGITETTVHVTYKEIKPEEIEINMSNIGIPLPTLGVCILDENLKTVPTGAAGELCVTGEGLGRGYLNRVELTREKFIDNLFKPGLRFYRSGDLARYLDNGDLEYFGRIDAQVKIRGYRIEPGEIENRLSGYNGINEVVVIPNEAEDEDRHLTAYIVSGRQLDIVAIREQLAAELPNYMLPSYFIQVEKIPLTKNGKVDRIALLKTYGHMKPVDEYIAPTDEIEKKMVEIWEKALKIERIGIRTNYFNAGGDSIKAIRLVNRINKELNTKLKIADLYVTGTIKELAEIVRQYQVEDNSNHYSEALREVEALKKRIMGG